ncbi:MAG: 1-(5-phosphoribosyl)-5-[(5-phosphoribosylamino) methylideneamino]imidazole-4-carboxamide isomerase [Flavisolibacter sp.]
MEIIPAIDIIDGKCVRLTQGDFAQKKIYNENPYEVARQFEDAGLKRLHLVDLDGARTGQVKHWKVLESLATKTSLIIDFGGGVASAKDVQIVLDSGASMISVGSIAVKDANSFKQWLTEYGSALFILGADVKNEKITISGWVMQTSIGIFEFIQQYVDEGIEKVFCTDVSKDGALEGPSLELYKQIISKFPKLHFIASGGVSNLQDLIDLEEIGCKGVIIGKAIYESRIALKDLKTFI